MTTPGYYARGPQGPTGPQGPAGPAVDVATHAASSKTVAVGADEFPLVDSEASFGLKKITMTAMRGSIRASKSYFVDDYPGADPTGTTFSDSAVDAAITAMGSNPGILKFGAGTYKLNTTKTLAYPGQAPQGQGLGATRIDWRGTGACFRIWDSTTPPAGDTTSGRAAPIMGFSLWGWSNTNASSIGMHIGDLDGLYIQDVHVGGLRNAGCIGVLFQNRYSWCERADISMAVEYCTTDVVFDRHGSHPASFTSFSYSSWNFVLSAGPNESHMKIINNTFLNGVNFTMFGAAGHGDGSNTGVVLTIGSSGSDTSYINGAVNIGFESGGSGTGTPVGHTDINIPNTSQFGIIGVGKIDLEDFVGSFVAGSASSSNVRFIGQVNCPSLGNVSGGLLGAAGNALTVIGPAQLGEIRDENNKTVFFFIGASNAANYLGTVANAAGSTPYIFAEGSDTNIAISLFPKGNKGIETYVNTTADVPWDVFNNTADCGINFRTSGVGLLQTNSLPVDAEQLITLTSTYTLTSQTAAQKLFNASANGAATLPVGTYFFECFFDLSSMSGSSGGFGWDLTAGTATIGAIKWWSTANKAALATAAAPQNTVNTAANTAIVTATTNTVGWARIAGKLRISAAGTVIPQVSLGVAAAAVVGVDSYFRIWRVGSNTVTTTGTWT